MAWPFGRKKVRKAETTSRPQAPRAAGVDEALLEEVTDWFLAHAPHVPVSRVAGAAHLHAGPAPADVAGAPAGALLKIKRGKLAWVDLWDATLRETINGLIKYLDAQQKWSFNGVVATKYPEKTP